jgi:hypothetical protein
MLLFSGRQSTDMLPEHVSHTNIVADRAQRDAERGAAPDFWKALGARAPSWRDPAKGSTSESSARDLPLHAKDVKPIDLEGLERLPLASTATDTWKDTNKWVCADGSYKQVNFAGKLERSRLSAEDERLMQKLGLIRELDAAETPTGTTRLFWVAEQAKSRRRPIRWTKAINEVLGRDTLPGVKMAARAEQVAQSLTGEWAICLDMSAWFNQIPFAVDAQLRHCFIGHDGKITASRGCQWDSGKRSTQLCPSHDCFSISRCPPE